MTGGDPLDDFLVRAALAGVGVALAAGPLGCFVVWRRMAYFGDATAHAAILGVALSLALSAPVALGVLAAAAAMGWGVARLGRGVHGTDAILAVLAHSALAAGLVAVSLVGGRVDLAAYLLGDVLAVGRVDLAVIWGGSALVLGLLAWRWSALLTATLGSDLARAEGIDPERERLVLTLALAVVVAVAIQVVGALLVAAMLTVPAAAARPLARTPEGMAALAAGFGATSALGGLGGAVALDTPAGPTMVCVAALIFGAANAVGRRG